MNGPKQGMPDKAREHEALLERVRVRIVGFATYLGCGNDAEDLAQETMLVLLNKYADLEDAEEMSKLAPRICANLALNWRRHKSNPAKAVELPEGLADGSGRDPESAATVTPEFFDERAGAWRREQAASGRRSQDAQQATPAFLVRTSQNFKRFESVPADIGTTTR